MAGQGRDIPHPRLSEPAAAAARQRYYCSCSSLCSSVVVSNQWSPRLGHFRGPNFWWNKSYELGHNFAKEASNEKGPTAALEYVPWQNSGAVASRCSCLCHALPCRSDKVGEQVLFLHILPAVWSAEREGFSRSPLAKDKAERREMKGRGCGKRITFFCGCFPMSR